MSNSTYCPEDNKLRLYCGRVDKPAYLALKAAGWKALYKQREAGGGDFVATWTPEREATAVEYSDDGIIEDEDMGPDERAADRAERFAVYREKREGEATGHADRYDDQPQTHGFQNHARAVRAADRHDKIGTRAVNSWDKAEYWQRRTAGVISHALHVCSPAVRMGRIKTIESDLRRVVERTDERGVKWKTHFELRLAYENQMLEAQGGRAAHVEMIPGGWLGNRQIQKVNKSTATGRVTSVLVSDNHPSMVNHWGNPFKDGIPRILSHQIETERMAADAYRAPTDEELAAFKAEKKARKAAAPKKPECPLINPTDEDAERLQAALNEEARADHCARHMRSYGRDYANEFKPSTVCRISQAVYSAASKGAYARTETRGLCCHMQMEPRKSNMYSSHEHKAEKKRGPKVCEIRTTSADGSDYGARRVIILTDKPQKPLPAAVWSPRVMPEELALA